ncbi:hypothetical protein FRC01_009992, partial [Tulasnella sp. 417]
GDDQQPSFTDERWAAFMTLATKVTSVVCESKFSEDFIILFGKRRNSLGPLEDRPFQRVWKLTVVLGETDWWTVFLIRDFVALYSYRLCNRGTGNQRSKYTDFFSLLWEVVGKTPTITDLEMDLPTFDYIPSLTSISKLRSLSCRCLDISYAWWMGLSWCKQLKELRLEETSSAGDIEESWIGDAVTFPALRILLLDAREEISTVIILNSRFSALEHLSFGGRCLSADGMERARIHLNESSPHLRV